MARLSIILRCMKAAKDTQKDPGPLNLEWVKVEINGAEGYLPVWTS